MQVSHDVVDGNEHTTAVRLAGSGAKATKGDRACLGRVVDKSRGIYRSREGGGILIDLTGCPNPRGFPARRSSTTTSRRARRSGWYA